MNKSPYLAFTALSYRVLHVMTVLVFLVVGFVANLYFGSVAAVLLSASIPLVLVFIDYFAFAGTSSRKQKNMQFLKSSCKGLEFFRSALKTDLLLKHFCLLFGYLGYILAEVIYFTDGEAFLNSLLVLLIYVPISELTLNITLILSRRIALSMVIQITVCYICSMVSTILLLVYSFLIPEQISDFTLVIIISFIIIQTISIIMAVILYKDCVKGYVSSFSDT